MISSRPKSPRGKTVWGSRFSPLCAFIAIAAVATPVLAATGSTGDAPSIASGPQYQAHRHDKLDRELTRRARTFKGGRTRVIVRIKDGATLPAEFRMFSRGRLSLINGQVVDLPNRLLNRLAAHPDVFDVHYDRPTAGANYRTGLAVGSRAVRQLLGVTGAGVGVALIDSGITAWHDDLTNASSATYPYGNQRVSAFVDFVNGLTQPYDDNGHGTHVAGIIAGNGFDTQGRNAGMAPDASLAVLKVLDANGQGSISHIIAALDWVLANKDAYNIRVVNLSVGAGVYESYWTDPLTVAVKRVTDAGVVVVAAAGNMGRTAIGDVQYGGITSPANAPWVLTVGASSSMGTADRGDDTVASYSSRGPTYLDWTAKPDIVAPGTGIVSLSDPLSAFFTSKAQFLLPGSITTATAPYLSLTGTSMSAPVVAGVVAQMLQVNPSLTPNAVKAILEYTAQVYDGYDPLTEGAGFLNAVGAVRLARFFATAQPGDQVPMQPMWSKHIVWGNHLLSKGFISPDANAFNVAETWGASKTVAGQNIVWGNACGSDACDSVVWRSSFSDNIVWGSSFSDNIVWGSSCTDASCANVAWGLAGGDDNIVWGSMCGGADCANTIWGSGFSDNIVWGNGFSDNIVWGSLSRDNIVWGNYGLNADNIVWGSSADADNIVWGNVFSDNIVWGNGFSDNIVWGSSTLVDGSTTSSGSSGTTIAAGGLSFDTATDAQLLGVELMPESPAPVVAPVVTAPDTTTLPSDTTPLPTAPVPSDPTLLPTVPTTVDPLPVSPIDATIATPLPTTTSTSPTLTLGGSPVAPTTTISPVSTVPGGAL